MQQCTTELNQSQAGAPGGGDGEQTYRIRDAAHKRKWFTLIPNLIHEMRLSDHAFRVYCMAKRSAGEEGQCFRTIRQMADQAGVGFATICRARDELVEAGLIEVTPRKTKVPGRSVHELVLVDIWRLHYAVFVLVRDKYLGLPLPKKTDGKPWKVKEIAEVVRRVRAMRQEAEADADGK